MDTDLEYSERFKEAKKLTQEITDFLNNFNYTENATLFCNAMSREHRTLQQSFTRLVLQWIEFMASDEYRYDGRNAQSRDVAIRLLDLYKDHIHEMYGYTPDAISKTLGTI